MSISEVKRFVKDCATDPSLANLVTSAGTDLGAVVTAANAKNYNFTLEEAVRALAQTKFNEIHASQLAGGKIGSFVDVNIVQTTNVLTTSEVATEVAAVAVAVVAAT